MSNCAQTVAPCIILGVSRFLFLLAWAWAVHLSTQEASLVYTQSPRPAKATWEDPVSEKKKRRKSFYPLEHLIIFTIPPLPNQVRLLLATLYLLYYTPTQSCKLFSY